MLQKLILSLNRVVANTFFRRIDVAGIENVPLEGPVIFAGNHPNALMDGFLLASKCGRWPLRFMVNAKLWNYKLLGKAMDLAGAVPVYRREEHGDSVDNLGAFERLYEVLEAGECMGIFPEGISHVESQLVKLKTGTARIALAVSARGKTNVKIVPCGLNYIHRHRFRSQALIEFGEPIAIDDLWVDRYKAHEQETVRELTDHLAATLTGVTLNAPDWNTLRFAQAARRLYKPSSVLLTPAQYIELNRRFIDGYMQTKDDPELQAFRVDVENYQARLEMLGLKDYQLRSPVTLGYAFRKIIGRSLKMLLLLPLAIPGALLHLPVGWIAAYVGNRFSYEEDDIATLKVLSTLLLLPVLYLVVAMYVGFTFGAWWALAALITLTFSFFASIRLIEAEASLLVSMLSILKLTRLGRELDELRKTRIDLVVRIRALIERLAPPDVERLFSDDDFARPTGK